MMNQQPQESIWGTINSCVEIALNIYMIVAIDENGREHTGIMTPKDKASEVFSSQATSLAKEDGDWLCFDENTKDAALYEVLQKRLERFRKIEEMTLQEMKELKQGGQIHLPEYFGECPAPQGLAVDLLPEQIRNGIYLIKRGEETEFAIHQSIADNYLTPMATEFGRQDGEYWHYSQQHCAIPVHELSAVFEEMEQLIISRESLEATLHQQFGPYLKHYNQLVPEDQMIIDTHAPVDLFLASQLEQENKTPEAEPEPYGEEVDFGFEL